MTPDRTAPDRIPPQREVIDGRHGSRRAGDGPGRGGPCAGAARPGARGDRDLAPRPAGPRGPTTAGGRPADGCHRRAVDVHGGGDHAAVDVLRRVHGRAAQGAGDPRPAPLVQPRGPDGADGAAARRAGHGRRERRGHRQRADAARRSGRAGRAQRALLALHPRRPHERAVRDVAGHGGRRGRGLVRSPRPHRLTVGGTPAHEQTGALRRGAPGRAPGRRRPGTGHPHAQEAARTSRVRSPRVLEAGGGQLGPRRR